MVPTCAVSKEEWARSWLRRVRPDIPDDVIESVQEALAVYAEGAARSMAAASRAMLLPGCSGPARPGRASRTERMGDSAKAAFRADPAWKQRALPLVERGLQAAFPEAAPSTIASQAVLSLWCLDSACNSYKHGASALLFDILQFSAMYGLPPEPIFSDEVQTLSIAALGGRKVGGAGEHRDRLNSHRKALICRLRYEHVAVVLQKGIHKMPRRLRAPGDGLRSAASSHPPGMTNDGARGGRGGLRPAAPRHAPPSPEQAREAVLRDPDLDPGRKPPEHVKAAVQAAIPLMPRLARLGGPEGWDTIYRNYVACRDVITAADPASAGTPGFRPHGWPGSYGLPSRRTCELLGWRDLFDAYDALHVPADDPLYLISFGMAGVGPNLQTLIR